MESVSRSSDLRVQTGYSLLEMAMVLCVAALLSVMAVGSFREMAEKQHAGVFRRMLVRSLHEARLRALVDETPLVLCGSPDQHTCSASWERGWLIKTMADRSVDAVGFQGLKGRVHFRFFPVGRQVLFFFPATGRFMHSGQNGTFWYCPVRGRFPQWAVMINSLGRVRTVYPDTAGKITDARGGVLGCQGG